jgi:DNA-binding phage protein
MPKGRPKKLRKSFYETTNGHSCVRFLFKEMEKKQIHELDFARHVGIERNTVRNWRVQTMPRVDTLDAALNALGYKLAVVPIEGGK